MRASIRIARWLAAALSVVSVPALAQSSLHYRSFGTDWVGQGQSLLAVAPDWTFTGERLDSDSVKFTLMGPGGAPRYDLHVDTKAGDVSPGPYEEAQRAWVPGSSPGVDFFGDGRGCNEIHGRFVILEAAFGAGTTIDKFAINFEQWCDSSTGPLHGELRFNSSIPLSRDLPAGDSTPDPFALQAQNPVRGGDLVLSNEITLYGVNSPVPISISGGEYSLNGAPFTSQPGTGSERGRIVVRARAPTTPGATAQAVLTAGGVDGVFTVQTYDPAVPLSGISYRSTAGDYIGQGETHLYLTPNNTVQASGTFRPGISFHIETVAGGWLDLALGAPANAVLVPGTYEGATRFPFAAPSEPGLDFGGNGRGCNTIHGRFTVHEASYAPDGSIERFAADFEQHCETADSPPLFGEIRYNSTVPFSALVQAPTPPQASRFHNLSSRARVMTGDDVAIAGFVISGGSNKTVLVRARGPSLGGQGVAAPLADPALQLFRSSDQALIGSNNDWETAANALALQWTGFQPSDPRESAMLVSLAPGAYTAVVSGVGGSQGVAIIEVFDMAQPDVRLVNISTRARVQAGEDVLIAGLVIQGGSPKTLVLRGRGPSLAGAGIANTLANPHLRLVRSDQTIVLDNDDWQQATNAAAIQSSGFAPSDAAEAAMLVTLAPGAYTVVMSGVGSTSGVGIVEVFEVP